MKHRGDYSGWWFEFLSLFYCFLGVLIPFCFYYTAYLRSRRRKEKKREISMRAWALRTSASASLSRLICIRGIVSSGHSKKQRKRERPKSLARCRGNAHILCWLSFSRELDKCLEGYLVTEVPELESLQPPWTSRLYTNSSAFISTPFLLSNFKLRLRTVEKQKKIKSTRKNFLKSKMLQSKLITLKKFTFDAPNNWKMLVLQKINFCCK